MILQLILQILIITLGLDNNNNKPKHSLHPAVEPGCKMNINKRLLLFLIIGMIIFAVIILLLFLCTGSSAVESGNYYNGFNSVI